MTEAKVASHTNLFNRKRANARHPWGKGDNRLMSQNEFGKLGNKIATVNNG